MFLKCGYTLTRCEGSVPGGSLSLLWDKLPKEKLSIQNIANASIIDEIIQMWQPHLMC